MMQDKIPPHSSDAEESVIGTILSYPESINDVMALLTSKMFYNSELGTVFNCCIEIVKKHKVPDLITVTDFLNKAGSHHDGVFLTQLTGKIMTSRLIENHALIIKEKYLLREYIRIGQEFSYMAYSEDLAAVSEKAEMDIFSITGLLHDKEAKPLSKLVDGVIDVTDKLIKKKGSLIGVPSGFTKLDRITGGFKQKELIIVAGRPSQGKTALSLQIAKNASELNFPVAIFSCEMSDDEIARRFLSGVSGKTNVELISGRCDVENLLKVSQPLIQLSIYIDDTSALSLLELRAKTRKLILKYGIKLIIVDYLQLMTSNGQNREQEISNLSRGLKSIAKDLDIPVITLSQLNRSAESRADRKPQLADLRESGAIEQDADIVILIQRPGYYGIHNADLNGRDVDTKGLLVLNIAKNRNGITGELDLHHNESMTIINE
jgi:replicative DNA helicase